MLRLIMITWRNDIILMSNFGIFLIHGDYWPGIDLLQTSDPAKNLLIKKHAMLIAPQRYHNMPVK
jgi:hypothetical protein